MPDPLYSKRFLFHRLLTLGAPGVLLLAILLVLETRGQDCTEAFDFAEVCSGVGILTRCIRDGRGLRAVALDVMDWAPYKLQNNIPLEATSTSPLDLLQPAGMALLLHIILRGCRRMVVHFGVPCASWVVVSRGSTGRTFLAPMGFEGSQSVKEGNLICARMVLAIYLLLGLQGTFTLEQPFTSLIMRHKRLRQLLSTTRVWKMNFWMKLYGHKNPKRSSMWSNSQRVSKFRTKKLKRSKSKLGKPMVKRYRNKEGKTKFQGDKKQLKASARYPLGFCLRYLEVFEDLQLENEHRRKTFEAPPAWDLQLRHILQRINSDQDLWTDAKMEEVLAYLRSSEKLNRDAKWLTDVVDSRVSELHLT